MTAAQDTALLVTSSILFALGFLFRYLRLPFGSAERRDARKGAIAGLLIVPCCWMILYGIPNIADVSATSAPQPYTLPAGFLWCSVALLAFGSLWFLTYFALAMLRGIVVIRRHTH